MKLPQMARVRMLRWLKSKDFNGNSLKNNRLMDLIGRHEDTVPELRKILCGTFSKHVKWQGIVEYLPLLPPAPESKNKKATAKERRATKFAREGFYESRPWHKLRYRILLQYGAKCMCCGATRKDGVFIQVDHIKPRSKYPQLELDFNNLQVLCHPCNMGKSADDETDFRPPPAVVLPWHKRVPA